MLKSFRITGTSREIDVPNSVHYKFVEIQYADTPRDAYNQIRESMRKAHQDVIIISVDVAVVVGISDCTWLTVDPLEYL